MDGGKKSYFYSMYGLRIRAEFAFPELAECPSGKVDIEVKVQPVAGDVKKAAVKLGFHFLDPARYLFRWSDSLVVEVRGGNTMSLDGVIDEQMDVDQIMPYLIGPLMNSLLQQRGITIYHAATLSSGGKNSKNVALCGKSGNGKSTTATALCCNHDYTLISDDVCAVKFTDYQESDDCEVLQGVSRCKLLPEALAKIDIGKRIVVPLIGEPQKSALLLSQDRRERFFGVKHFVFLSPDSGNSLGLTETQGHKKFEVLIKNTYWQKKLRWMGGQQTSFMDSHRLARTTQVWVLSFDKDQHDPAMIAEYIDRQLMN